MTLNYKTKTIELNKTEAKEASQFGTDLYNQLVKAKADFPNFEVKVVSPKGKRADSLKGLTYEVMESYLANHGSQEQIEEFNVFRSKDEFGKAFISYGEIKKWFLNQFPEVLNKRAELKNKIAASAKKEVA